MANAFGPSNPGSQLQALQAQMASMSPDSSLYRQYQNQAMALMDQAQSGAVRQSNAAAAAAGGNAYNQAMANRTELYGNARGRLNAVTNDPVDALVLRNLQNRATGVSRPYDSGTISAYLTDQSNQAAQAEKAQLAHLGRTGMTATDPGFQAAQAEALAGRQAAMQNANLNINENANLANYSAQGTALGQLGAANNMHQNMVNDSSRYLGGLLQGEQFTQHNGDISSQVATMAQPIGGGSYTNIYGQTSQAGMPGTAATTNANLTRAGGYSTDGQFQGYGAPRPQVPLVGVRKAQTPTYGYTYGTYNPNQAG